MKSMNNNNWLGFSLSPHLNIELSGDPHHHHHQRTQTTADSAAAASAAPTRILLAPHHLNSSGLCYGAETGNGSLYSQLSVMPLKSDGSLCIMEALSRSQQEGMNVTNLLCSTSFCFLFLFFFLLIQYSSKITVSKRLEFVSIY